MNPDVVTAGTSSPVQRSLELRGPSSVITVTVRSITDGPTGGLRGLVFRVSQAIGRAFGRQGGTADVRHLEPAELPPQLIVLSHYQQALRGLPGDDALAEAVGVATAEVEAWKAGQMPNDEQLRRLRDLATIVARLADYYDPRAIPDWLYGQSPDLGGRRPVELLREGNLADVLSVAEAQISGAYV
jgi:hypothetical protein